jgi:hypothetical protein
MKVFINKGQLEFLIVEIDSYTKLLVVHKPQF